MTHWTGFQIWLICILSFLIFVFSITLHPEWFDNASPRVTTQIYR